jgi:hypothetical protein
MSSLSPPPSTSILKLIVKYIDFQLLFLSKKEKEKEKEKG